MAQFKEIKPVDVTTSRQTAFQPIVISLTTISSSNNRRKYQSFVTGGIGPGVTSSLYQSVHDTNWRLGSANPVFDVTVGIYSGSDTSVNASIGVDSLDNLIFSPQSLQMDEKIDIYRQYAQNLLGNAAQRFVAPFNSESETDIIDEAIFLSFRRPFSRDGIHPDTFVMSMYATGANVAGFSPIASNQTSDLRYYTEIGTDSKWVYGGEVGNVIDTKYPLSAAGLMFYDHGTLVLDAKKVIDTTQNVTGAIRGLGPSGFVTIGGTYGANPNASYIPDFFVSGSIDDIVDYIAGARLGGTGTNSQARISYQNRAYANATVYNCRAKAEEFNFSSNPTFTDAVGNIVVISDPKSDEKTFSFITTIGLYDANDNLLAIAKLGRPFYKDDTIDVTFKVRLNM
jgi:hypothetical protein